MDVNNDLHTVRHTEMCKSFITRKSWKY